MRKPKEPLVIIYVYDYRRVKPDQFYCSLCELTLKSDKMLSFCPFCRNKLRYTMKLRATDKMCRESSLKVCEDG